MAVCPRYYNPALIQAVFHVGDHFWVRQNQRRKNKKKKHFSKISYICKRLMHITSLFPHA